MKTTVRILTALTLLIGAEAQSATITSIVSYVDLADYGPPYPIQIMGSPAFGYGASWHGYWGTIKVASDPDEEIYSLTLNSQKDPNQRTVDFDVNPYANPIQGAHLGELIDPGGESLQEWGINWNTGYLNPSLYQQYQWNIIQLTGTLTLNVRSSIGDYSLATYQYIYPGIIPEPSSTAFCIIGTALSVRYRRRCPCKT